MYMYPIIIKKEPQIVNYHKKIQLDDDVLTLDILRQHVKEDELFWVTTPEGMYGNMTLSVSGKRMETEDEVRIRVESNEKYMKDYAEFHARNPRN